MCIRDRGMGVIFYLNACDTPDRAQWLPESDKTCVEAAIARSAVEAHQQVRLTAALFNWKVWTVGLVLASGYLALYGIIFWLPSILKNSGISSFKTIGLLSAVPWVLAAGATLLFGYTSDRFEKRRIHIFAGLLLGALGLAASVKIAHSFAESYAALSVGCACIVGTFAVTWSLVSQHLGKRDAAAGFALTNTLASVGSFVGPYLMGASQEHFGNLQMPTLLLAMVTAAGAVLILSVPESQQRRNHRQIVDV
ncbi:MFS transporter [Pseudomonas aeruginosa]|nr:MFS transporter [Pseudomonas aeruginosa]